MCHVLVWTAPHAPLDTLLHLAWGMPHLRTVLTAGELAALPSEVVIYQDDRAERTTELPKLSCELASEVERGSRSMIFRSQQAPA